MADRVRSDVVAVVAASVAFAAWMAVDPAGDVVSRWVSDFGLFFLAVAATPPLFRAGRLVGGTAGRAWRWFGISNLAWAVGQLCYALQQNIFDYELPVGSLPDLGYVTATVTGLLGAASLASGSRLSKLRVSLDGVIAALALLGVSWIFVVEEAFGSDHLSSLATVTATGYKIADVLLLALLLPIAAGAPREDRSPVVWLTAGKFALGLANAIYTVMVANGSYRTGHVLDVGWFLAFAFVLLAGRSAQLRPATWRVATPQPRSLVPYVPVVVGAVWIIWIVAHGATVEARVVLLGAVIALLMVPRQWVAINEHATSHRRLAEAQQAARIGSWDEDPRTGRLSWSDQMFAILGLDPAQVEPSQEVFRGVIHPDDRDRMDTAAGEAQQVGAGHWTELRLRLPDGSCRWIRVTTLATARNGDRFRGTAQDITDAKTAELALRQSQKLEAVGRLASGIAHDFNNLLTPITLHAELLGRGRAPEQDATSAAAIAAAATRAGELTHQLLAFCRGQEPVRTEVDVRHVVAEVVQLLGPSIRDGVELEVHLADGGCIVDGDPAQLHQVVMNLAVNALDAMPGPGRLVLSVETRASGGTSATVGQAPDGATVAVTVSDTGAGMDAETAARCFDPFFTTKPEGRGTGLGLATVYGLVTSAGGGIHLDTRLGVGTSFTVLLPRSDRPDTPSVAPAADDSRPATIVVVDDDAAIVDVLRQVLAGAGHEVVGFDDSRQALNEVRARGAIDLLVTDVSMPHLGGFDLADGVRAHQPEVPVLFMSGYHDGERRDLRDGERPMVLTKPFSPDQLEEAVAVALAR